MRYGFILLFLNVFSVNFAMKRDSSAEKELLHLECKQGEEDVDAVIYTYGPNKSIIKNDSHLFDISEQMKREYTKYQLEEAIKDKERQAELDQIMQARIRRRQEYALQFQEEQHKLECMRRMQKEDHIASSEKMKKELQVQVSPSVSAPAAPSSQASQETKPWQLSLPNIRSKIKNSLYGVALVGLLSAGIMGSDAPASIGMNLNGTSVGGVLHNPQCVCPVCMIVRLNRGEDPDKTQERQQQHRSDCICDACIFGRISGTDSPPDTSAQLGLEPEPRLNPHSKILAYKAAKQEENSAVSMHAPLTTFTPAQISLIDHKKKDNSNEIRALPRAKL